MKKKEKKKRNEQSPPIVGMIDTNNIVTSMLLLATESGVVVVPLNREITEGVLEDISHDGNEIHALEGQFATYVLTNLALASMTANNENNDNAPHIDTNGTIN